MSKEVETKVELDADALKAVGFECYVNTRID